LTGNPHPYVGSWRSLSAEPELRLGGELPLMPLDALVISATHKFAASAARRGGKMHLAKTNFRGF